MGRLRGFPARSQSRRPRRVAKWGFGVDSLNQAFSSSTTVLWSTGVVLNVGLGEVTVVRLRGSFVFHLGLATAAGDGFFGAFGIALASEEAFAQGITSLAGPVTDADADQWIFHTFFKCAAPVVSSTSLDSPLSVVRIDIDSKAMRKWDEDKVLYGATEVTEIGTASAVQYADSRLLVKLS